MNRHDVGGFTAGAVLWLLTAAANWYAWDTELYAGSGLQALVIFAVLYPVGMVAGALAMAAAIGCGRVAARAAGADPERVGEEW